MTFFYIVTNPVRNNGFREEVVWEKMDRPKKDYGRQTKNILKAYLTYGQIGYNSKIGNIAQECNFSNNDKQFFKSKVHKVLNNCSIFNLKYIFTYVSRNYRLTICNWRSLNYFDGIICEKKFWIRALTVKHHAFNESVGLC